MWERAEAERSGPVEPSGELDPGGITVLQTHPKREAEYPKECGDSYCPGGLRTGDACRFAAECASGDCVGAGECGKPPGTCG
jgi:hypothetical protein